MVCTYHDDEIITFLQQIVETNSFRRIDGKCQSNIKIFDMLAAKVYQIDGAEGNGNGNPSGWDVKTGQKWRIKWKALKSKYLAVKAESAKSGAPGPSWRFFERMRDVMGHRPISGLLPISNNINDEMEDIDRQAIQQSFDGTTDERPASAASTSHSTASTSRPNSTGSVGNTAACGSGTPSLRRKRHHSSDEDDWETFRREMREQRKEDMQSIGEMIERSNKTMLEGLSHIITQAMQPPPQPMQPPPQPMPMYPSIQNTINQPIYPGQAMASPSHRHPMSQDAMQQTPTTTQTAPSPNLVAQTATNERRPSTNELNGNCLSGISHVPDFV